MNLGLKPVPLEAPCSIQIKNVQNGLRMRPGRHFRCGLLLDSEVDLNLSCFGPPPWGLEPDKLWVFYSTWKTLYISFIFTPFTMFGHMHTCHVLITASLVPRRCVFGDWAKGGIPNNHLKWEVSVPKDKGDSSMHRDKNTWSFKKRGRMGSTSIMCKSKAQTKRWKLNTINTKSKRDIQNLIKLTIFHKSKRDTQSLINSPRKHATIKDMYKYEFLPLCMNFSPKAMQFLPLLAMQSSRRGQKMTQIERYLLKK